MLRLEMLVGKMRNDEAENLQLKKNLQNLLEQLDTLSSLKASLTRQLGLR